MPKKSKAHDNPEMELSFAHQNKRMDQQENRLNVEILRVHTIEKQRIIQQVWSMGQ